MQCMHVHFQKIWTFKKEKYSTVGPKVFAHKLLLL